MNFDINLNQPVPQAELWLAKPDRTLLCKLTQRGAIGFSRFGKRTKMLKHTMLYKLNNVNELEFSLPFEIEIGHELVRNPAVDLILDRYLIKCLFNGSEEWFVITNIIDAMDGDKNVKTVSARSLVQELINRSVRQLDLVAVNLSTLLNGGGVLDSKGNSFFYNGLLHDTLWGLSVSFDATFDTIFRSFNVSQATILDVLIQSSKAYDAIMIFDTVNRKINFQQLFNIGQDKGFKISYKNYMKSVENTSDSSMLATRFIPVGKNNLGINSVNPTAQNYLEDLSFFLYPFSRDASRNIISHSNYLSDSTCHALLDFQVLLQSNQNTFSTLLTNLTTYQTQLTTKQNDMATLKTTLTSLEAQFDIASTTGQPTTTLQSQITTQNSLIASKQTEIDSINASITSTNTSIATLNNTLSKNNNFTAQQLTELSYYVFEKSWDAPNISDAQSLYNQANIEFAKFNSPQTVVKVDAVNLLEMISESRNWDKLSPLSLGDTIGIEYNTIGTNIKAKLIEFAIDHIESNITLTIANVDDIKRDEEKVFSMLYKGIGASNTISTNLGNWNQVDGLATSINNLYNNGLAASAIAISAAVNNSVKIDNRGITISDSTDPTRYIRMTNGVIGLTKNGIFTTAITPDSILAPAIVGQLGSFVTLNAASITAGTLSSVNIAIGTGNQIFKVDPTLGFWAGNQTFGSAPFRCDMLGNTTLNSLVANSATINNSNFNNGAIVGSSIDVGSGNFHVTSGGIMSCTGASVSGNITAINGNFSGNITSSATITGGTFQTASSGGRLVLSGGTLQSLNGNTSEGVTIHSLLGGTGGYLEFFNAGTSRGQITGNSSSQFKISASFGTNVLIENNNGYIDIHSSDIRLNGATTANAISASSLVVGGTNVLSALSGKTNVGSSTSSFTQPSHDHGIPAGTVLLVSGGGTVTWVPSGGFSHSHTTN